MFKSKNNMFWLETDYTDGVLKQHILILWFVSYHTIIYVHFFVHIHTCNQRFGLAGLGLGNKTRWLRLGKLKTTYPAHFQVHTFSLGVY